MSQATPLIGPNKSGLTYRQEDNDGKKALLNHHKGATAPAYGEAGTLWLDDAATPWLLKMHDGVDWISLSEINATTNTVLPFAGQTAARPLVLCADEGAVDAYAVTLIPAVGSYTSGLIVMIRAESSNTGAATLAVNGLSPVAIKMPDGSGLSAGAMLADGIYMLCHDGINFILLNASSTASQVVLQSAYATYTGYAAITNTIPVDDTVPTSTEGTEILSVSITPQSATSRIRLHVNGMMGCTATVSVVASMLVHGESSAFASMMSYGHTATHPHAITLTAHHEPGSTAPITYKVRLGVISGTMRPNGNSSGRLFGGTAKWTLTAEEYAQ